MQIKPVSPLPAERRMRPGMAWSKAILALWLGVVGVTANAFEECGDLRNAYGPIDYRIATPFEKHLVESEHFLPYIEHLQRGNRAPVGGDLDYTLRAFPNHPRALLAMMRLGAKENAVHAHGALYPVECYFERGIRFTPDDPAVHTVYGIYLVKKGEQQAARRELELAREALQKEGGDPNPNLSYNLGLAYFDLKDYERALEQAKIAYGLGFPLPGLRDKLKRANKWEE